MSKKDSGPAFPYVEQQFGTADITVHHRGMSLRDYFAAHAPIEHVDWTPGLPSLATDAARAYRWADALLAEREK